MSIETQQNTMSSISARIHPNCVVCSSSNTNGLQLEFVSREDGGITAKFMCDGDLEGYPGVLHGGIVSSIMDGAMCHCMFSRGQVAVTAEMTTKFRHPVVTNQQAIVTANVTGFSHSLCLLEAEIVQDGKVKATAKGKFFNQEKKSAFKRVSYTLCQTNNQH